MRKERGWPAEEMARRLRDAADGRTRAHLPDLGALVRYIRRWEAADHGISERYRLLYARAFATDEEEIFEPLEQPTRASKPRQPASTPFAPEIVDSITRVLHGHTRPLAAPADLRALQDQTVRAWELRQSTQYAALGGLLTNLLAETESASADARAEHDQLKLASVSVHAYNAASSLLKRLEAPEVAAVAADRAYRAGHAVGDQTLIGAAVLRIANVYLSARRYHAALDTASAGADMLAPGTGKSAMSATYGALLLTAALAAAHLDEGPRAWEFLGQAKVASIMLDTEYVGLHAVFGPVNLAIHGVQVATELGDAREALRRAELVHADSLPPALLERRSTLLVDIARNYQQRREHRSALDVLLDAERLAPQEVRYNRVAHDLVGDLLRAPRGATAENRELAGRMGVRA